jgi:hypothetical protein
VELSKVSNLDGRDVEAGQSWYMEIVFLRAAKIGKQERYFPPVITQEVHTDESAVPKNVSYVISFGE